MTPDAGNEPAAAHCPNCGAAHSADAKFCAACGHELGAPVIAAVPKEPLPRQWVITAIASAVALVLFIGLYFANRPPPGPSNSNARKACAAMTDVSKQIVAGEADSFEGLLGDALKFSRAAAKDDKKYAVLSGGIQRLSEDPHVSSEKGGKAIETIAEACR